MIGGGVGGATVARTLASGHAAVDVTLIEQKPSYVTCFFSNHYLAGLRSLESLTQGLEMIGRQNGVVVLQETITAIDPSTRHVSLQGGAQLPYDRLVLSPGVSFDFDGIEGLDPATSGAMPHAWSAGRQSEVLRRQLEDMEDGGVFVITVPPRPFRCPVAPYERASLVASYFKKSRPRSKVLILDSEDSIPYQDIFEDGWARHYPGMIEWLPVQFTDGIEAVDIAARTVITRAETFEAAVASVIPAQSAGPLAVRAGLTDASDWCPVDPRTFESSLLPDVYVVGDAALAGDMPKSASSAQSQGRACALAIAASLTGEETSPPALSNACYTFLGPDDAFVNASTFEPNTRNGRIDIVDSFANRVGDKPDLRRRIAREADDWYAAFTRETFG